MFGLNAKAVDVRAEKDRYKSQQYRILELLKGNKQVTNVELQRIAFNYTMRISELRKEGHKIVSAYEKPGVWNYAYLGHKDDREAL